MIAGATGKSLILALSHVEAFPGISGSISGVAWVTGWIVLGWSVIVYVCAHCLLLETLLTGQKYVLGAG